MRLHVACLDFPEGDYQPQWITIRDQSFEGKMIPVDNHQYGNCVFLNCHFLYSGGPFGFHECTLDGTVLLGMAGAAQRTSIFWRQFQEQMRRTTPPV